MVVLTAHVNTASAAFPDDLAAAWDTVLVHADDSPAARYGFYAYRSIAVAAPELLLRGDMLFADWTRETPGSRRALRNLIPHDTIHYDIRDGIAQCPVLSLVGWAPVGATEDTLILPDNLPWLTTRVAPLHALLKSDAAGAPKNSIEAAFLRYAQYRQRGHGTDSLYVVIDTDRHGWLYVDSVLYDPTGDTTLPTAAYPTPVLVFNERSTFSTLTGRNDTGIDEALAAAVLRLPSSRRPDLTATEERLHDGVRRVTTFHFDRQLRLASLIAIGLTTEREPRLKIAWNGLIDSARAGAAEGRTTLAIYWANRLTPRTVAWAARLGDRPGPDRFQILSDTYLAAAGRMLELRKSPGDSVLESSGAIWGRELFAFTIDDLVRNRAGEGRSQALAISAILDHAGVANYRLHLRRVLRYTPQQHWVLTADGLNSFNFGLYTPIDRAMDEDRKAIQILDDFGLGDRWTLTDPDRTITNWSTLRIAATLVELDNALIRIKLAFDDQNEQQHPLAAYVRSLNIGRTPVVGLPWPEN